MKHSNRSQSRQGQGWHTRTFAVVMLLLMTSCGRTPVAVNKPSDVSVNNNNEVQEDVHAPDSAIGPRDADTSAVGQDGVDGSVVDSDTGATDSGGAFELPKTCEASDLPAPEQSCATEGEIRCTNIGVGEYFKYISDDKRKSYQYRCYRPNHLRCTQLSGNKMVWKLESCRNRQFDKAHTFKYCSAAGWSCIREPSGDRCGPTFLHGRDNSGEHPYTDPELFRLSQQYTAYCDPNNPQSYYQPSSGMKKCGGGMVLRCKTFAEAGALGAKIQQIYGPCAKYLEKGVWLLPETFCPFAVMLDCPAKTCYTGMPGWPNCKGTYLSSCLYDPTQNGQARCRLSCDDHPDKPDVP